MPLDKIVDNLEKEGELVGGKKPVKLKKAAEKPSVGNKETAKTDNNLFNLVIAVIVILGIIGIVFGYTKDKITELREGGSEVTEELEKQVADLKEQLKDLGSKATQLEKENLASKNVVIDLFEKYRQLPRTINTEGWKALENQTVSFTVSFPQNWEEVKNLTPSAEDASNKEELVYLQPTGEQNFLNAILIKSDYADFSDLSLKEKVEIFKELDALDTNDFLGGKMIYFINLDKDNREVPTVLILTADKIFRTTFNIADKKTPNYFQYRKEFEDIIATFSLKGKSKK